jgi:hypothetical protein
MSKAPLYIHKARIFDIAGSMGVSLESVSKLVTLRTNTLIKKAIADFRNNFIDAATPAVHRFNLDKDVINKLDPNLPIDKIRDEIKLGIKGITTDISVADLSNKVQLISNAATAEFDSIKLQQGLTGTQLYNRYRQVTQNMGKSIAALFPKTGLLLVSDPEKMGYPGDYIFLARSFKNLRDTNLNKVVNAVIKKYNKDLSIGSLTVLGHTAVEVEKGVFRINTPLVTETLLRLEAGGLAREAQQVKESDFVKQVPLFLKHKINFTENFTPTANLLLEFGFSFSVGMDPTENTLSGSSDEKRARDNIVAGLVFPELEETIRKRVAWLKDSAVSSFKNSPTMLEYIRELVVAGLIGKQAKSYKAKESKSGALRKGSLPIPKVPKVAKGIKKPIVPNANISFGAPHLTTNLVSLQALLDAQLVQRVKDNMGGGTRRDVLNLRSGRLAESAKVERLSESRAGMITAFYSYMKNPYATFSQGGRQQSPRSRDPKSLISKSIREIAATQVGLRLRAVLV